MPRYSTTSLMACATVTVGATFFSAACSSATHDAGPTTPSQAAAAPSEQLPAGQSAPDPGATGISPDGVTTSVDVPSEATESQYGQACHAARIWLGERQQDPRTLVEPYLKTLQDPAFVGPATFDAPWVQLTPSQRAGVIMAVNAAADGQCD